ncbi:alpha/beta hydrolase [Parageobacillus sp. KH3-4]|uniref:alpha/beta hydrolase n=1 Tax=Parageobacillus sp. KH3-4 TaxID=2916802 RepID=UPI00206C7A48|nr:alpha/beta hydrolase [Parageobacillus sp. KH3-4]BDG45624.1 ferri-bacillibactin esterase BesA [Parageobacillus sp. KH3-4]
MAYKKTEQASMMVKNTTVREFTIPRTEQRVMYSRAGNREYRIFVARPDGEPPPSGFPVIYLLDANAVFGTMVEAMRVQASRSDKTGVVPTVIVGIGYPTEMPFAPARFYDFTMPASVDELPARPDGTAWPEMGGAEAFLKFIEEELKPEIECEFEIDRERQALFGHSLGGLFALHVLFTKPTAFRTYIAGSPSIHWNKRFLLEAEQQFVSRLERETLNVDILLAVGELERSHKSRISNNAKELAERLSALAHRGVYVEFEEFEGEGHVSVLPALVSRALRFASRRK